jgi:hypothetical protein
MSRAESGSVERLRPDGVAEKGWARSWSAGVSVSRITEGAGEAPLLCDDVDELIGTVVPGTHRDYRSGPLSVTLGNVAEHFWRSGAVR